MATTTEIITDDSLYPSNLIDLRPEMSARQLGEHCAAIVSAAADRFKGIVADYAIREPEHRAERQTTVSFTSEEGSSFARPGGWQPKEAYRYQSFDPYQFLNPDLTEATTELIDTTMAQADILRETNDPTLTYLSARRGSQGKRMTPITRALVESDPIVGEWIVHLPDAERLRPVAHPWSDEATVVMQEDGSFKEIPNTKELNALVGGAGDGRAVREREGWERECLSVFVKPEQLKDQTLVITSLGTGTGEPAMDTGRAMMQEAYGDNSTVVVHGFDVSPKSLKVAEYMASKKEQEEGARLEFHGHLTNLLSAEGIQEAVAGTQANVYEAIGFAEYVPSDSATDDIERKQRELTRKMGWLSAEEFYAEVYKNMPKGSVLLTGNMRNDSPQATFVTDGAGWKGIIQRSTEDYLQVLEGAGIPGEAVTLFVPDLQESAGVYNLVAIVKQ